MVMAKRLTLCLTVVAAFMLTACGGDSSTSDNSTLFSTVLPRSDRELAVAVTPASDGNASNALSRALAAHINGVPLGVYWDSLESSQGNYSSATLSTGNQLYGGTGLKVALEINPLDTLQRRMPDYLDGLAMNDPQVVQSFENLLDWVFTQIPAINLHSLTIGNEVDVYLGNDATRWAQYTDFVNQIITYVHNSHPDLPVGVKTTLNGAIGLNAGRVATLNANTDVVQLTYYPLNSDFTVQDPGAVKTAFDKAAKQFPDRQIDMLEVGYPSNGDCGGSPARQADFVRNTFSAWDAHIDQIEWISFFWLSDIPNSQVDSLTTYYGITQPCFASYLGSLGLVTEDNADKPAFRALQDATDVRGWRW